MSYKYILKYKKTNEQTIIVEAWPRLRVYATKNEIHKPSFIIGSVKGSRTVMLSHYIDDLIKKYVSIKKGPYLVIQYPAEDPNAVNDAYRLGLAAATVEEADNSHCAQIALRYIMQATKEEIWFWTSKLLGVIGDRIDKAKVLMAINIISGAKNLNVNNAKEPIKKELTFYQNNSILDFIVNLKKDN